LRRSSTLTPRSTLLALVAILLLSACTSTYKPAEYPLRDEGVMALLNDETVRAYLAG